MNIINYTNLPSDTLYFYKGQELYNIISTFGMFPEELGEIVFPFDSFIVEYDTTVKKHILLHESQEFKETKPICYLDLENWNMKEYHSFIISSIRHAWCEKLI